MAGVKLEIKGDVKAVMNFKDNIKHLQSGITQALTQIGDEFNNDRKQLIETGTRTGRRYPNMGRQSSAEGEPPASQSGRLANSGKVVASKNQVEIGETAPYAGFLERGTRKMGKRPHMELTAKRNENKYLEIARRIPAKKIKAKSK